MAEDVDQNALQLEEELRRYVFAALIERTDSPLRGEMRETFRAGLRDAVQPLLEDLKRQIGGAQEEMHRLQMELQTTRQDIEDFRGRIKKGRLSDPAMLERLDWIVQTLQQRHNPIANPAPLPDPDPWRDTSPQHDAFGDTAIAYLQTAIDHKSGVTTTRTSPNWLGLPIDMAPWKFGAALALVIVAIVVVVLGLQYRDQFPGNGRNGDDFAESTPHAPPRYDHPPPAIPPPADGADNGGQDAALRSALLDVPADKMKLLCARASCSRKEMEKHNSVLLAQIAILSLAKHASCGTDGLVSNKPDASSMKAATAVLKCIQQSPLCDEDSGNGALCEDGARFTAAPLKPDQLSGLTDWALRLLGTRS